MNVIIISIILIVLLIVVIFLISHRPHVANKKPTVQLQIKREEVNPVIKPGKDDWHAQGTFNPAAIKDKNDKVHILYRAVGSDGVSRISYASSKDGVNFDDVVPYPIFIMENSKRIEDKPEDHRFDPVMYPSGGSWGGVEDPRVVSIDGRIYMTFHAFDGWDFLRIGIASISEDDLFNKRFKWSRSEFLSPKGQVQKNWMLFPEKINGKFAILHSITPTILIDYVDKLEEITQGSKVIESRQGPPQGGRKDFWDNRVRGAGPPPIKTSKGWLVLYHAVEKTEAHKYKLGAMLLDLKDPTKIIARTPNPLLEPDMWYENDWKPGIIYACGAVVRQGELYVYYGGGDKYVCVAKTPLDNLLNWMIKEGKVS